jgi:hypothetical protein
METLVTITGIGALVGLCYLLLWCIHKSCSDEMDDNNPLDHNDEEKI